MSAFNNFGATEAALLRVFAVGGYTATAADLGGSTAIADELENAANQVIQSIPLQQLNALHRPEFVVIEARAAAGQTTATLPLLPAVSGKTHIWRGQPGAFVSIPVYTTDPWGEARMGYTGIGGQPGSQVEIPEADFSVVLATGVVTLATALARNDMVLASYEVDVESGSFSVASIAGMIEQGAAAALGAKVYTQTQSEWQYIAGLRDGWLKYLEDLSAGNLVPSELRALRWWKPPEKTQEGGISSVRRYRG